MKVGQISTCNLPVMSDLHFNDYHVIRTFCTPANIVESHVWNEIFSAHKMRLICLSGTALHCFTMQKKQYSQDIMNDVPQTTHLRNRSNAGGRRGRKISRSTLMICLSITPSTETAQASV